MENKQIVDTLNSFHLPAYNEIPDVGLYLEQVAKFINIYFKDFPEMQVTPSMISNYAKQKLFNRVNKKTYTREQIALLFFIICSKTVLSIENIRFAIQEIHNENETIENLYQYCKLHLIHALSSFTQDDHTDKEEVISDESHRMLKNIITAVAHKMYLDRYFATKK
ncbi:MAG: DUF1836 domain-containing protein [Erysipelotrichaceae bacterium]|nr:DUF1836 domain-containing protein [Erysipelotrichaceae bacterium]MDY6035653.1 DUF1836 domain-containing protein [Bulleidia sp.]